jgi:LacI family transcriptional regulator
MFTDRYKINLLFNASKVYDRRIIEGIGNYFQTSRCDWDVFVEEDFRCRVRHICELSGDGIIADYDNPEVVEALQDCQMPIIGTGSSYSNPDHYPDVPYYATDNEALVNAAYDHLINKGLQRFAFYGLPESSMHRWAREREKVFIDLSLRNAFSHTVYRGHLTSPDNWQTSMRELGEWLQSLPQPTGIIAVTDSRARHILQICSHLDIMIPDQISLIGIDDEELTQYLSRISLSSVAQGCQQIGFKAARHLHSILSGKIQTANQVVLIPPKGIVERQSSDFRALQDPNVIKATHFIRHNACRGIKVSQVVDYVGISRSNLETRFLAEYGHSMHTELHQTKFNRAKNLLETTNIPIPEIADSCGFLSTQYLYTVFRRNLQTTPKEYRCMKREENEA